MRLGRVRRYNPDKPGSHEIAVWCCDWDLALLIKAIRTRLERAEDDGLPPGTVKRYRALERCLRTALSKVLKIELADIRRQKKQIAEIEQFLGNGVLPQSRAPRPGVRQTAGWPGMCSVCSGRGARQTKSMCTK
mgnify:CR=1 FL=1